MFIRAGSHLRFGIKDPRVPIIFRLEPYPDYERDIVEGGNLEFSPAVRDERICDPFGNATVKVVAAQGQLTVGTDLIVVASDEPDPVVRDAEQLAAENLPGDVLPYLLASRYCEVDGSLNDFAWRTFGLTKPGWDRVQAVCDFVHNHLTFDYASARPTRTAGEAWSEGRGVCRDFTHLAMTLCRCLNIPARYCSGYLGDIRIEPLPSPMDFSAWMEVYLSGQWYTFDARFNVPRIGRIVMVRGRDAVDSAFATMFGRTLLVHLEVWADEVQAPTLCRSEHRRMRSLNPQH